MANQDSKSLRCSAEIPITEQDGIDCSARTSVMTEAGPRCPSCLAEFGGVALNDDEITTFEQASRLLTSPLGMSAPGHTRKPYDLGTVAIVALEKIIGGAA